MIHMIIRRGRMPFNHKLWSEDYQVVSVHGSKLEADKRLEKKKQTANYCYEVLSKRVL